LFRNARRLDLFAAIANIRKAHFPCQRSLLVINQSRIVRVAEWFAWNVKLFDTLNRLAEQLQRVAKARERVISSTPPGGLSRTRAGWPFHAIRVRKPCIRARFVATSNSGGQRTRCVSFVAAGNSFQSCSASVRRMPRSPLSINWPGVVC